MKGLAVGRHVLHEAHVLRHNHASTLIGPVTLTLQGLSFALVKDVVGPVLRPVSKESGLFMCID